MRVCVHVLGIEFHRKNKTENNFFNEHANKVSLDVIVYDLCTKTLLQTVFSRKKKQPSIGNRKIANRFGGTLLHMDTKGKSITSLLCYTVQIYLSNLLDRQTV